MSAFIVDSDHIDALLSFAIESGTAFTMSDGTQMAITPGTATDVGRILLLANVLGVRACYPDRAVPDVSRDYTYRPLTGSISVVQAAKACECLDFQALEDAAYKGSIARQILKAIWPAGVSDLSPVWQRAQWEYSRAHAAA